MANAKIIGLKLESYYDTVPKIMTIKIIAFGKIADILPEQEWKMDGVQTSGALREQLEASYPALKDLRYLIAVDKKIASDDSPLEDHSVVALLPPFSGG